MNLSDTANLKESHVHFPVSSQCSRFQTNAPGP